MRTKGFPKRQKTGALQDASRVQGLCERAPVFGLRQSPAAFPPATPYYNEPLDLITSLEIYQKR
jgi:hypothetical protein